MGKRQLLDHVDCVSAEIRLLDVWKLVYRRPPSSLGSGEHNGSRTGAVDSAPRFSREHEVPPGRKQIALLVSGARIVFGQSKEKVKRLLKHRVGTTDPNSLIIGWSARTGKEESQSDPDDP